MKIPPKLHALVMKLAGDGLGSEEIAAQLWLEQKVEVTARSVRRVLERARTERANVAKSVVREELRKYLVPLVHRTARAAVVAGYIRKRALMRAEKLRTDPDGHPQHPLAMKEDALALSALDRELKCANLLMHYAGLNTPDQPGDAPPRSDARATLVKRLEQLINPLPEPAVH